MITAMIEYRLNVDDEGRNVLTMYKHWNTIRIDIGKYNEKTGCVCSEDDFIHFIELDKNRAKAMIKMLQCSIEDLEQNELK